jgi:hypothetical protein
VSKMRTMCPPEEEEAWAASCEEVGSKLGVRPH